MKYGKSKVLICEIMGFVSISWKEQHPGGLLANSEGKNVLRNLMRIPYRRLKAGFFCVLKEKRIIPSVSGGIKSFEHFQRGEYFSDCSFDSFVSWFRLLSPGWSELKPAIFLLANTFSHAQIYSLCRTSFILLFGQRTILCAVKLSRK